MSGKRAALLTIPLAIAGVLGVTAPAQAAPTHHTKPASLTCQGKGIDRSAKVHYRTETFVKAPLRTIWNLQTDVEAWPSWQNPAIPVTMKRLDDGPLRKHSRFQWTIPVPPGMPYPPGDVTIVSTVRQLQPGKCLRWTGPLDGPGGMHIDGVHVWNFVKVPGGVIVRTEESHTGPQVDKDVPGSTAMLGQGLEIWLKDLKKAAEHR
ncbi:MULTISPECIES: SRPBCC family protein [Amycolatopsis]|uniref:Conserved putative secreted protein n=1 Tax=Amycolatopsis japonica TaxID=208439 RepID=A0A075UMH4_9PSEU|nr:MULTISPECIES: SRPBCC family protein [Amycolatopsis]AIG74098.1 Conserved putative secreted protein [Amycolatopsis japonica]OKJ92267.1 polyketide cyclase /reductase [Amycolatopsis sp. CB00013]